MGLLISLVSLVGGATVFPALSSRANVIYRQRIKQEQSLDTLKDHIVAAGRNRQRFTIAHELGHFMLHHESPAHYDHEKQVGLHFRAKMTGAA